MASLGWKHSVSKQSMRRAENVNQPPRRVAKFFARINLHCELRNIKFQLPEVCCRLHHYDLMALVSIPVPLRRSRGSHMPPFGEGEWAEEWNMKSAITRQTQIISFSCSSLFASEIFSFCLFRPFFRLLLLRSPKLFKIEVRNVLWARGRDLGSDIFRQTRNVTLPTWLQTTPDGNDSIRRRSNSSRRIICSEWRV